MYTITFVDGTIFNGGTLHDSKWNEMPSLPIKKIDYCLFNKTIVLENYEAYNHLIEFSCFINSGQKIISKIILLGKKDNQVINIIFDILKKQLYSNIVEYGKEYNGKSTGGWKVGITKEEVHYTIN